MLKQVGRGAINLLAFYVVIFGIVGLIGVLDSALQDYHNHGRFFMRTGLASFVMGFVFAPIFGLYSLFKSFVDFSTFGTQWEIHLIILAFFALAITGYLKENRLVLTIAALMPLIWAIIDLNWLQYI